MHLKFLFFLCFIIYGQILAQNTSVFTSHYNLNLTEFETKDGPNTKYKINEQINQSIGLLLDGKKLVHYGEFILGYSRSSDLNEPFNNVIRKRSVSSKLNFGLQYGIGKSFRVNKHLKYYLIAYLGYAFQHRRTFTTTELYPSNKYPGKYSKHVYDVQSPASRSYSLGAKAMLNYELSKQWFLGVSINCSLIYMVARDIVGQNDKRYNLNGIMWYSYRSINTHNTHSFTTSFSQFGIYVGYTFK